MIRTLIRNNRSLSLVNPRSRCLAFTVALLAWALPCAAHADRVVLYPVTGRAEQDRLDAIHALLGDILREQGHTVVLPASAERPLTSSAMEAAASVANASYVVVADVDPLRAQYRMHIHVYYRPHGRLEDLVVTVLEADERTRLSDVASSMVRREGLGDDALRLTGGEAPTRPSEPEESEEERLRREEEERRRLEEEERARREAEEAARLEEEERARREAEERVRREQDAQRAWNERLRYGADGRWMAQLLVGGSYAVRLSPLRNAMQNDGGLFDIGARVGRTFEGLEGFELRGGIDLLTGEFAGVVVDGGSAPSVGFTGLALHAGAAWLGSFFVEPIYLGAYGEVGVLFTFTGARDVGFSGRVGALVAWRPVENIVLEAALPELGIVTPGSGAFTIGTSVRASYRFD